MSKNPNAGGAAVERLPIGTKILIGMGDHTLTLSLTAMSVLHVYFLTEYVGLRPALAGTVPLIGRFVDAFTDPLMGRVSDLTTWRAGRRRPYFALGALPFVLSFALLWADFGLTSQVGMFVTYTSIYILYSLCSTVLTVPYVALLPEITRDYHERNSVNAYRSAAALLGTLVAGAGFRPLAAAFGDGGAGFLGAAIVLGLWMLWPWFALYRTIHERPDTRRPAHMGFVAGMRMLASHAAYRRITGFYLCSRVAIDVTGMMLVFYFTYCMRRPSDFEITFLLLLIVAVAALPAWMYLARRLDKRTVFIAGATWWGLLQASLFLATPEWPRALVIGCTLIAALGYGCVDMMPWSMLADVVDEDELRSGERREGLYAGVFGFLRKLGGASAVWIAGISLDLAGFVPGTEQAEHTLWTIRALTALVPAATLGLGVVLASGYDLGRVRHTQILAELASREGSRHNPHPES